MKDCKKCVWYMQRSGCGNYLCRNQSEYDEFPQKEAVKPDIYVKTKSAIRRCGACGERIYLSDTECRHCGTPIDWEGYKRSTRDKQRGKR